MAATYLDFDLLLEPADGGYRARVLSSPAGQAQEPCAPDLNPATWSEMGARLGGTGAREVPEAELQEQGQALFRQILRGRVEQLFRRSLDRALGQNRGLRLRLRLLDAPELITVPWEILYDPQARRFLALSEQTPLLRYLEMPEPERPLTVAPPLRVLAILANPTDLPPLSVEREQRVLTQALASAVDQGRVEIVWAERADLPTVQEHLRRQPIHAVHFIGHGLFDPDLGQGVLAFEDEEGRSRLVSAGQLGVLLQDRSTLRLVVLNSCDTARADPVDPFSGIAQHLVRQGIAACAAMQVSMPDRAAVAFARTFYPALVDGLPLDTALVEARKAIYFAGYAAAWAVPALYTHASDGRIFARPGDPARGAAEPETRAEGSAVRIHIGDRGGSVRDSRISIGDVAGRDLRSRPKDEETEDEEAEDTP